MSTCNCTEIMARFKFYVCFFLMKWKYIRKFDYECVCLCIFELSNIKKKFSVTNLQFDVIKKMIQIIAFILSLYILLSILNW